MRFNKIRYLLIIGFVFCFKVAYAAEQNYCQVKGDINTTINIPKINLDAATENLTIIAESGDIAKTITCLNVPSSIVKIRAIVKDIPYNDKIKNEETNKDFTLNSKALGLGDTIDGNNDCPILRTGYNGIGVVWFNYNSLSSKWFCATQAESWGRNLDPGGKEVSIIDRVYLVKTGPILPGQFVYTPAPFLFTEYTGTSQNQTTAQMEKNKMLYTINIAATDTTIEAPVCEIVSIPVNGSYIVNTRESLNSLNGFKQEIKFNCSNGGVVLKKGSNVSFKLTNFYGLSTNSSEYLTSIDGLNASIEYSLSEDAKEKKPVPDDGPDKGVVKVKVVDTLGNGNFFLYVTPKVVYGKNGFPVENNADFKLKINLN